MKRVKKTLTPVHYVDGASIEKQFALSMAHYLRDINTECDTTQFDR